jgi:hypothetical protein
LTSSYLDMIRGMFSEQTVFDHTILLTPIVQCDGRSFDPGFIRQNAP